MMLLNNGANVQALGLLCDDLIAQVAGYCEPWVKNKMMLTCRQWALVVCNRTWMIQMNPLTISYSDKLEALIRYAQQGNDIMVKRLLDDDVDPNSVNILGLSPCHVARSNCMAILKQYNADFSKTPPSVSLLHQTIYDRDINEYLALLEYASGGYIIKSLSVLLFFKYHETAIHVIQKYNIDAKNLGSLLITSVRRGNKVMTHWLIDYHVSTNIRSELTGNTLLY